MPSNAMKMSQLVARLQKEIDTHGDLDVVMCAGGAVVAIDGRNVNVAMELPTGKLPRPALVMGLWQNERGALQNMPGQVYQHTPDADDWNYDRAQAPDGAALFVWKRYGGEDAGRTENGKWYVSEGGPSMIEIVPEGILAWRVHP